MANRGAAAWISSLPVFPANHSPQPGRVVDLTMTVGSGLQSQGLSLRYDPVSLCWRTCHQLFEQDYPLSSQTLPNSGSMRNGDCTAQPTLVPLIEGNDGGVWPTPTAFDANTPANISPEARERQLRRGDPNGTRRTSSGSLAKEVLWPTPRAMEAPRSSAQGTAGPTLTEAAVGRNPTKPNLWPTPQAADGFKIGSMTPETAARQAAADHQEMLMGAAVMWPTPKAHDGKAPRSNTSNRQSPDLHDIVSHQHATTPQPGHDGSAKVDLNPWFVASLMGLPPDWLTHCTSAVTDWCHKQQQQQSDNSLSVAGGNYE